MIWDFILKLLRSGCNLLRLAALSQAVFSAVFVNGRRVADKSYDALKANIDTEPKVRPSEKTAGE